MPNNKVQLSDGTVLMDTSGVTVTPEVLMQGYTALDKTGAQITGTATAGGAIVIEEDDEHGGKVVHITGDVVKMQSKTVTPTKATQNVTPDAGYNALSGVTVNPIPDNYIEPTGSLTITQNGTVNVANYESVLVNVPDRSPNIYQDDSGYIVLGANGTSQSTLYSVTHEKSVYGYGDVSIAAASGSTIEVIGSNVFVVPSAKRLLYEWDLTSSATDSVGGATITFKNATRDSSGLHLSGASDYATIPVKYRPYMTYEFDISSMSLGTLSTHGRLIMVNGSNGLIFRSGAAWSSFFSNTWDSGSGCNDAAFFANKTLSMVTTNGAASFYLDGQLFYTSDRSHAFTEGSYIMLGSSAGQSFNNVTFTGIRVYSGMEV